MPARERFPTTAIFVTAISWLGFAVWLGSNPQALLPAFGVDASSPPMMTEIRAFYGGVEAAIGVTMIVLWWRRQLIASLLVGGLPLLGAASGRIIGMAIDGFAMIHAGFASLEILGAGVCLAATWTLQKTAPSESNRRLEAEP